MSTGIDPQFFQELAEKNPEDVCRRVLCVYDEEKHFYTLSIWGDEYMVSPHEHLIKRITDNQPAPCDIFHFFILHYLLHSRESEVQNEWISEKEKV